MVAGVRKTRARRGEQLAESDGTEQQGGASKPRSERDARHNSATTRSHCKQPIVGRTARSAPAAMTARSAERDRAGRAEPIRPAVEAAEPSSESAATISITRLLHNRGLATRTGAADERAGASNSALRSRAWARAEQ